MSVARRSSTRAPVWNAAGDRQPCVTAARRAFFHTSIVTQCAPPKRGPGPGLDKSGAAFLPGRDREAAQHALAARAVPFTPVRGSCDQAQQFGSAAGSTAPALRI